MWVYPAFAIASVAFFLIGVRWAFGSTRSGLIGGEMISGFLFILLAGAPLTLLWFAILQAVQKARGWDLSGDSFVIGLVVTGCLQWIIWSQIIAFLISTFVFSV